MSAPLATMARWLEKTLGTFPAESNGVWRAGDGRAIRRLGVALEGSEAVAARATTERVDGLLLHRPWRVGPLPPGIGVLAAHEALDDRLTLGDNPWLAARLGLTLGAWFGERRGWPLVVIAEAMPPMPIEAFWQRLAAEFPAWSLGPHDSLPQEVGAVALANAMRPSLVEEAAAHGPSLYLTGTLRPSALDAVRGSGMAVVLLGHRPPEAWGLRWLANSLAERYDLEVVWLDGSG